MLPRAFCKLHTRSKRLAVPGMEAWRVGQEELPWVDASEDRLAGLACEEAHGAEAPDSGGAGRLPGHTWPHCICHLQVRRLLLSPLHWNHQKFVRPGIREHCCSCGQSCSKQPADWLMVMQVQVVLSLIVTRTSSDKDVALLCWAELSLHGLGVSVNRR